MARQWDDQESAFEGGCDTRKVFAGGCDTRKAVDRRPGQRALATAWAWIGGRVAFAALVTLVSCQVNPDVSSPDPGPASGTITLESAPATFPPASSERASEEATPLDELIAAARTRWRSAPEPKEASETPKVNVASATGAPARTREGDYQRFLALNGDGTKVENVNAMAPLVVRFDRPVVGSAAVGTVPSSAESLLSIWPQVAGELTWHRPDALEFKPAVPWKQGTDYHAAVGVVPLNERGAALVEGFSWRFSVADDRRRVGNKVFSWTPNPATPKLVGYYPDTGAMLAPGEHVALIFDQPVVPALVARHLELLNLGPKPGAFASAAFTLVEIDDPALELVRFPKGTVVALQPDTPHSMGQSFQVVVQGALLPETANAPWWIPFGVAVAPKLSEVSCPRAGAVSEPWRVPCGDEVRQVGEHAVVSFHFSNPISAAELQRAITVEPAPLGRDARAAWSGSNTHDLSLRLAPGENYVVRLHAGLRDQYGLATTESATVRLRVPRRSSVLELETKAGSLELNGRRALRAKLRNISRLNVSSARIANPQSLLAVLDDLGARRPFAGAFDRSVAVEPAVPAEEEVEYDVDLSNHLGKGPGVFVVQVEGQGLDDKRLSAGPAILQVTNLGITSRHSAEGLLVWVTRLDTGAPVAGVSIEVLDGSAKRRAVGLTDEDGVFAVESDTDGVRTLLITATLGSDLAYTELSGDPYGPAALPSATRPDPGRSIDESFVANVFSERGVYRPGQTAFFKIYVRALTGSTLGVDATRKVVFTARDPRGKIVSSQVRPLNEFGAAEARIAFDDAAPLGWYGYELRMDGFDRTLSYGSFQVEEYRPPRFEVKVASSPASSASASPAPAPMRSVISGRYLFGGPMVGAQVSYSVSRSRTSPRISGLTAFQFHDPRQGWHAVPVLDGKGVLDDAGELAVRVDPSDRPSEWPGPWRYEMMAQVQDVDRQAVSQVSSFTVHDRDVYLGVRRPERIAVKGEMIKVEVVAAEPGGKLRSGVAANVRLLRREWHSVERRGPGGSFYSSGEEVYREIGTCRVVTRRRPASCRVRVSEPGSFMLVVEGKDRHGRQISTGDNFYAYGEGYVPWRPRGNERETLGLVADRPRYQPGDVAKLLVKSPWKRSWALVSAERDRVFTSRVVQLDGSSQVVELPITEDLLPNFTARVTVVRGRLGKRLDGVGNDRLAPSSVTGEATIWVDAGHRQLDVAVRSSADWARPGDEVGVEVEVKGANGEPVSGEVTVWMVDEAVLQLTDYQRPEPHRHFYAARALDVVGQDSRVDLLTARMPGLGTSEFGGDGAEGGSEAWEPERVRRDFRTTLFFVSNLVTDPSGVARVTVELPDNLTRFRVMATAADRGGRFGSGGTKMRVRKPLMVRPALPRFAHVGDRFDLAGTVYNATGEDGTVEVTFETENLELLGQRTSRVLVPANASVEVRTPVQVADVGESAQVTLRAAMVTSARVERDMVQVALPLQLPGRWEHPFVSGSTRAEVASFDLAFPKSARPEGGTLEISVSTTLLSALAGSLDYVVRYPYGCVEQTTSATMPLLVLNDRLRDLGLDASDAEVDAMIRAGIKRLESMSTPSGGLGYWPGASTPHPFGTAFALVALAEARDRDFTVSPQIIDGAGRYLEGFLADNDDGGVWGQSSRALSVFALATAGRSPERFVGSMTARRNELDTEALALVSLALHRHDSSHADLAALADELASRFEIGDDGAVHLTRAVTNEWAFGSADRSLAMALLALTELDTHQGDATSLAETLVRRRKGGRWGSTQSDFWGLTALARYVQHVEGQAASPNVEVRLGEEALAGVVEGATLRVSVPMWRVLEAGESTLEIHNMSPGAPIYTALGAHYLRGLEAADNTPAQSGMAVFRSYTNPDGSALGKAITPGQVVVVELLVQANKETRYVALDDPLPAAFEPINLALSGSGGTVGLLDGRQQRFDRDGFLSGRWYFGHSEQRDDRVLYFADWLPKGLFKVRYLVRATGVGEFTAPPAKVAAMYDPARWARTGFQRVEVR